MLVAINKPAIAASGFMVNLQVIGVSVLNA